VLPVRFQRPPLFPSSLASSPSRGCLGTRPVAYEPDKNQARSRHCSAWGDRGQLVLHRPESRRAGPVPLQKGSEKRYPRIDLALGRTQKPKRRLWHSSKGQKRCDSVRSVYLAGCYCYVALRPSLGATGRIVPLPRRAKSGRLYSVSRAFFRLRSPSIAREGPREAGTNYAANHPNERRTAAAATTTSAGPRRSPFLALPEVAPLGDDGGRF
jgi:hypothetical protein